MKRESRQKRAKEKGVNRPVSASYLESNHDEGSDDENAISLSAIKNRYKRGLLFARKMDFVKFLNTKIVKVPILRVCLCLKFNR